MSQSIRPVEEEVQIFGVVGEELIKELHITQQDRDMTELELRALSTKFDLLFAKAARSVGAPIQDSSICLKCRSVHLKEQICPRCKGQGALIPSNEATG